MVVVPNLLLSVSSLSCLLADVLKQPRCGRDWGSLGVLQRSCLSTSSAAHGVVTADPG
jgi:hypothetical protein